MSLSLSQSQYGSGLELEGVCPTCHLAYEDAYAFPCGHTFCGRCADTLALTSVADDRLDCLFCPTHVVISSRDSVDISNTLIIARHAMHFAQTAASGNFFQNSAESDGRFDGTSKSLAKLVLNCPMHPSDPIRVFCPDCKPGRKFCIACAYEDKLANPAHNHMLLDKIQRPSERAISGCQDVCRTRKEHLQGIVDDLQGTMLDETNKMEEFQKTLNEMFSEIYDLLQETKTRLLTNIERDCQNYLFPYNRAVRRCSMLLQSIEYGITLMQTPENQALTSDDMTRLHMAKTLLDDINSISLGIARPIVTNSQVDGTVPSRISFERDHSGKVHTFVSHDTVDLPGSKCKAEMKQMQQKLDALTQQLAVQAKEIKELAETNGQLIATNKTLNDDLQKSKSRIGPGVQVRPSNACPGLRVVRGEDFSHGNQDGGPGKVGIIVEKDPSNPNGWAILWLENGQKYTYDISNEEECLLIFANPISMYTEATNARGSVTSDNAKAGLKVRRGKDWKWADQDGGAGKTGTLVQSDSAGWWKVKWDTSGNSNNYRVGAEGKYDLEYASGPPTPPIIPSTIPAPPSVKYSIGDSVQLAPGYESVKDAKDGPLKPGERGSVVQVDTSDDTVRVKSPDGRLWWYGFRAVKK
eukprot:TRINITY_DN10938_c0_g1_i5.p1 TRINITY_DN10938_c0_g1~~TRINITY_DN10938_c0_g1_i5.p1  ORF type:complete len:638 (-),score=94.40 TRINITY_DN10938_c0_g1_i5:335-2248(-)